MTNTSRASLSNIRSQSNNITVGLNQITSRIKLSHEITAAKVEFEDAKIGIVDNKAFCSLTAINRSCFDSAEFEAVNGVVGISINKTILVNLRHSWV